MAAVRRNERGSTAVEFALILVPMLVVIFGLIQYGLYFYSAQTGSNTVNAAVRQLSVGNCQATGALQAYVEDKLGTAATDGTTTVTPVFKNPDGSTPAPPAAANVLVGGTVTLTISFNSINMNFPFVPFLNNAVLVRKVQARVEDTTDQGCGS